MQLENSKMLSKASQYAIKALIFIGSEQTSNGRATLEEVAKAINSPKAYTSKILQQLVAAKMVNSTKGSGGGFEISPEKLSSVKIKTILRVMDASDISSNCFLGFTVCGDSNPCPVHHIYQPIRENLNQNLLNVTLRDIMNDPRANLFKIRK